MTHCEKVAYLLDEVETRGMSRYVVAPPLHRLAWRLGVEIPPPHFQGFLAVFLSFLGSDGLLIGIVSLVLAWTVTGHDVGVVIRQAVVLGGVSGFLRACAYRRQARRLDFSIWTQYPT